MNENQRDVDAAEQPVAGRTRRFSNASSNPDVTQCSGDSLVKKSRRIDLIAMGLKKAKSSDHTNGDQSNNLSTMIDRIVEVLTKESETRTEEESRMLGELDYLIPEAEARLKAKLAKSVLKQRSIEQEESLESIERKADTLAQLIKEANYIVVYTGAGISTSASIPDYRGPNGLWTQIKKTGTFSITKTHDLSNAEPTLTHMAIRELCRRRIVNHVVSQNCDGLHLRSGIPQTNLSEIHGNMYIEVCPTCERQYFRQADITERTSRFRHKTGRKCHTCAEPNNNLIDTIVLYGERSRTQWPMNWERAGKAAKRADLIICMGSSLKTLRRYNCLWPKRISNNLSKGEPDTKLAIINLQYTSKDKNAVLKINGKCDLVMQLVMQKLSIDVPVYDWTTDPLYKMAIPFTPDERASLKRNLIFESKATIQTSASPSSGALKRPPYELSQSPSLFVSELTDEPDKKRLRMRIRAVNMNSPSESSTSHELAAEEDVAAPAADDTNDTSSLKKEVPKLEYVIPGWLGKSIGNSRPSSYRRKRHGNKGRKHPSVLKPQQSEVSDKDVLELAPDGDDEVDDTIVAKLDISRKTQDLDPQAATNNRELIIPKNENNSPINCAMHLIPSIRNEQINEIKQET